jgi:tetratricopeptide (TPR) repeat protein
MQLNLFEDNRPTVLLNIADEFVRLREFTQALSVYDQLVAEYPDDKQFPALRELVGQWLDLLSGTDTIPVNLEVLHSIWLRLDSIFLPSLSLVALDMLIDAMFSLAPPEQCFLPPRFHLGQVLMKAGRFAEAADCFHAALSSARVDRGRFLAWHGDALTLAGNHDAALKSYFDAFLDDPISIDVKSVQSRTIHSLRDSLHFDATDEIEEQDEPAWIPVWGWIGGVFALSLRTVPEEDTPSAAAFAAELAEKGRFTPRIWFDMLAHAERVRTVSRDSKELGAVRRLMKNSNEFMFGCYLGKINGSR